MQSGCGLVAQAAAALSDRMPATGYEASFLGPWFLQFADETALEFANASES